MTEWRYFPGDLVLVLALVATLVLLTAFVLIRYCLRVQREERNDRRGAAGGGGGDDDESSDYIDDDAAAWSGEEEFEYCYRCEAFVSTQLEIGSGASCSSDAAAAAPVAACCGAADRGNPPLTGQVLEPAEDNSPAAPALAPLLNPSAEKWIAGCMDAESNGGCGGNGPSVPATTEEASSDISKAYSCE